MRNGSGTTRKVERERRAPLVTSPPMPKARILVVDDEPNARAGLRTILTEDGVEALERLRQEHTDLVLADIRMPRMDGVTLVQTARKEGIPASFVMMTAF